MGRAHIDMTGGRAAGYAVVVDNVTLSMPSVLGQTGVVKILEPVMSAEERQALQRSAEALKAAAARI